MKINPPGSTWAKNNSSGPLTGTTLTCPNLGLTFTSLTKLLFHFEYSMSVKLIFGTQSDLHSSNLSQFVSTFSLLPLNLFFFFPIYFSVNQIEMDWFMWNCNVEMKLTTLYHGEFWIEASSTQVYILSRNTLLTKGSDNTTGFVTKLTKQLWKQYCDPE